jgi:hypothetical protein
VSVLEDFFRKEWGEAASSVVHAALASGEHRYLTLNIFNLRIDPASGSVTVEDVLDPSRDETVSLSEFGRQVHARRPS